MLNDAEMRGLVEVALDMSARQTGGRWNVTWNELADYLHDIYIEYGSAPELADPADWTWVAKEIYQDLVGQAAEQMVGSTKKPRRTARRGEDLGRPRMHREKGFGEDQFKRFTHTKNTKKRKRHMNRQEGGYKSKKKLYAWLDEQGAPYKKCGDETYGKASMIYICWPDMDTRREWERKLQQEKFHVQPKYSPGQPVSEIRVSYFKGWHWDE
jgi:hypothetical protein